MHLRLRMILSNITWYIRFKITIVLFAFTLILNIINTRKGVLFSWQH